MQHNRRSGDTRRAAALDLGSNTLRLLAAELEPLQVVVGPMGAKPVKYSVLARGLATPRLGRGLTQGGKLDAGAKKAAFEKAAAFVARARKAGAERVSLAATQACRKAADGAGFVAELKCELKLDSAVVLSGEKEAALSRLGVMGHLHGPLEAAWLADVGGGSSEIMPLVNSYAARPVSLPLGAVSLSEAYVNGDPPTRADLAAMAREARRRLEPLAGLPVRRLVATAGTAAALAGLVLGLEEYQPGRINNLAVSREDLRGQLERLAALPLAARKKALKFDPKRADIIVAGLTILDALMELWGQKGLTAMDAGLLEGVLFDSVA